MFNVCNTVFLLAFAAQGATDYTDKATWQAVWGGDITSVGFADLPSGTVVTDQYADEGLLFTDGNDRTLAYSATTDGMLLMGSGRIEIALDTPAAAIGVDYPGGLRIQLFNDAGDLVYTSGNFGGNGAGFFGGVIDGAFTYVVLSDWVDDFIFIDNVHVGFSNPDEDGDGVNNDVDACPGTAAGAPVLENGCSVDQTCPCDDSYRNHGAYVSCVALVTATMVEEGVITQEEQDAIVATAAQSTCGR